MICIVRCVLDLHKYEIDSMAAARKQELEENLKEASRLAVTE